jgi:hypothetical protein
MLRAECWRFGRPPYLCHLHPVLSGHLPDDCVWRCASLVKRLNIFRFTVASFSLCDLRLFVIKRTYSLFMQFFALQFATVSLFRSPYCGKVRGKEGRAKNVWMLYLSREKTHTTEWQPSKRGVAHNLWALNDWES